MTCRDVDQFLLDYLEGTLSVGVRVRFTAHLAVCSECRRYLDTYRQTVALGRAALVEMDVPAPIPDKLVHAILASRASTDRKG